MDDLLNEPGFVLVFVCLFIFVITYIYLYLNKFLHINMSLPFQFDQCYDCLSM